MASVTECLTSFPAPSSTEWLLQFNHFLKKAECGFAALCDHGPEEQVRSKHARDWRVDYA
jgi:hypothetical protein